MKPLFGLIIVLVVVGAIMYLIQDAFYRFQHRERTPPATPPDQPQMPGWAPKQKETT